KRIAARDLNYSSVPVRQFQMTCDRRAWRVQPGDVLRIQDPTRSLSDVVIRIGAVEDGTLVDGRIHIAAVEDIFIFPRKAKVREQESLWIPPDDKPKIARRIAYEIPYANLNRILPPGE